MKPKNKSYLSIAIFFFLLANVNVKAFAQINFRLVQIDANGPESPWGKAVGDVNDDGLADLIAGGYTGGGLVWYKNPGSPAAEWEKITIEEGKGFSTDVEMADVDRDGIPDVVVVTKEEVVWFKNDGSPENGGWTKIPVENRTLHDIEVGDFDGDGDIDIIGRNQSEWGKDGNVLHFYEQISPEKWVHTERDCPHGEGLLLADIDEDGKADILAGNRWYKNRGSMNGAGWPEFILSKSWEHGNVFIATGDIDGDGRDDIVLTPSERDFNTYHISWFRHPVNPQEEWPEHIVEENLQCTYHFVGCGDFDLDGNIDIVAAEMVQSDNPDEVLIYRNQRKGTLWNKAVLWDKGSHSCRVFDCDNDGDLDFFGAAHIGSEINLWVNQAITP